MTKFTIEEKEIERLKVYSKYLSDQKSSVGISDKQLFVIDNSKLGIYAIGEGGSAGCFQQQMFLDIKNLNLDTTVSNHFILDINDLILLITKISGDSNLSLHSDKLEISFPNSKFKSNIKLLLPLSDDEVKEITNYISGKLNSEAFKNKTVLNIENLKKDLNVFSDVLNIFNQNNFISIEKNIIKSADQYGIFKKVYPSEICANEILFPRAFVPLIADIPSVDISSDDYYYLKIDIYGIEILRIRPVASWAFPSDNDLNEFLPDPNSEIELEVKAKDLFEGFSLFTNTFVPSEWAYGQIKITTPDDFDSRKELDLYWEDGKFEISHVLPVSIVTKSDPNENYNMTLTLKEFLKLEKLFYQDDNSVVTIKYSSVPETQNHGRSIIVYQKDLQLVIPKMTF